MKDTASSREDAGEGSPSKGRLTRFGDILFTTSRREALLVAGLLSFPILAADALVHGLTLGAIYVIPLLIAAPHMTRLQVIAVSIVLACLRESVGPTSWGERAFYRLGLTFVAYTGVGLFVGEMGRNRTMALEHLSRLENEVQLRKEKEQLLRTVIDSNPAAIFTTDSTGRIELCNRAACELFGVEDQQLAGRLIGEFLPVAQELLQIETGASSYRAATTCQGIRSNGEPFQACLWFSTYPAHSGVHLAAVVTDTSEDLRDSREASFQSLLRSTRVLVGSVSHEIRNICAAISVVHANLGKIPGLAGNEDYAALGTLAGGLAKVATVELQSAADQDSGVVDLSGVLDELRIVMGPEWESLGIQFHLTKPPQMALVRGDHHGLLQVLLNVTRNSVRAMENSEVKRLTIEVENREDGVLVRIRDTGPGVANPERLFQPFQPGADIVGLGLFVSRSIVRAAEGELYYVPGTPGCTICMELRYAFAPELAGAGARSEVRS